jgi:acetolactate synthase-1/2/3 large subunit
MNQSLRGADVLARALAQGGTRRLFSLSGNHIMPVYDAALDARLAITHVRHEGAAVHMADAWGRLTGEPGIALLTGGPGHANGVGALYTALAAESPLVMLSGSAPLSELGRGSFQEMPQAELAATVTKESWTAQKAEALGEDIARAMRIARSGRPGPVHVILPFDLLEK